MTETRQRIRAFIADTFFVENFADTDSFLRTRIIDSTGMLELVAFIEQAFKVHVPDSELVPGNLDSVENLVNFLERASR
jgi:acyl carrier protein